MPDCTDDEQMTETVVVHVQGNEIDAAVDLKHIANMTIMEDVEGEKAKLAEEGAKGAVEQPLSGTRDGQGCALQLLSRFALPTQLRWNRRWRRNHDIGGGSRNGNVNYDKKPVTSSHRLMHITLAEFPDSRINSNHGL